MGDYFLLNCFPVYNRYTNNVGANHSGLMQRSIVLILIDSQIEKQCILFYYSGGRRRKPGKRGGKVRYRTKSGTKKIIENPNLLRTCN